MARRIVALILILCVTTQAGAIKYVGPVSAGAATGASWATRAKADSTWFTNNVVAGDTILFYPGFYDSLYIIPPARTHGVITRYWAGDGTTNLPYDPGVASLASPFTRAQFNQSLLVAKACTLTAAITIPAGSAWTNYSGAIYYRDVTVPVWDAYAGNLGVSCLQDTLLLGLGTSAATLTVGYHYYDPTAHRLYVWCSDGTSPTTKTIYISRRPVFEMSGGAAENGNFQLYGFDLRCAVYAAVDLGGGDGGRDSVWVDHCRVTKVNAQAGSNSGVIGCHLVTAVSECGGDSTCTYASDGKGSRIRACYVSEFYEPGKSATRAKVITVYNQSHLYVESCYVYGGPGLVDWKNNTAPLTGISYGNVARFNTIAYWHGSAAYETLSGLHWYDSCYGNVFIGDGTTTDKTVWYQWDVGAGATHGNHHFLGNNTFYNCGNAITYGAYDDYEYSPNWIKYNIFYGGSASINVQLNAVISNDNAFLSDSNMFYGYSGTYFRIPGPTDLTLAQWQTRQSGAWAGSVYHDIHSTVTNPNFVSIPGLDFRRTGSPSEMDATYGGYRWTSYGAEGSSGPAGENPIYKTKASGTITVPNGSGGIQWR